MEERPYELFCSSLIGCSSKSWSYSWGTGNTQWQSLEGWTCAYFEWEPIAYVSFLPIFNNYVMETGKIC